jgi:hypothetical protein
VAIGAQQSKVLQRVVFVVPVDVVQLQRDLMARPHVQLAARAPPLEDAFVDKAPAQPIGLDWIFVGEVVLDRSNTVSDRRAS